MKFRIQVGTIRYASAGSNFLFYNFNRSGRNTEVAFSITKLEVVVQQMLLNYLQDAASADDGHLFVRWFYLLVWYKDDPKSQQKFMYYLARLKSKEIVWDSGTVFSLLTRDSVKKITLALGQKNSFSRGFDKILHLLLVSKPFHLLPDLLYNKISILTI
ncbi:hypothetical protein ACE6H2_008868 [Prunus campanulata]